MKKKLPFGNDIVPACEYCEFGREASDYKMILCSKRGIVSPYFRCRRFVYSPLRRIPKRMPNLPKVNPDDFVL